MSTHIYADTPAREFVWDNGTRSLLWKGATGSAKIEALVRKALERGLVVDCSVKDESWAGGGVWRTVTLSVRRPHIEEHNALEQIRNADRVHAMWGWVVGNGATPKLIFATTSGLFTDSRDITARVLPYALELD